MYCGSNAHNVRYDLFIILLLQKMFSVTFYTWFLVFWDQTWGIKMIRGGGGGGARAPLVLLVAHLSYLRPPVFQSHEGGSLNCPKTPPGWRLFPFICRRQDARAIYRTPLE